MKTAARWKAIACDLDGTLLSRQHTIHPRDAEAVRRAREAGIHVAICTGRNAVECIPVIEELGLTGPGVFANGATLCAMEDRRAIRTRCIQPALLERLVAFFGSYGHAGLVLAVDPDTHLPVYIRTQHGPPHRATVEWLMANKMQAKEQDHIDVRYRDQIVRANIVVDVPEAPKIAAALNAKFGDEIYAYSIHSAVYDCQVIEAFSAQTTKWKGIELMAEELGISPSSVVAVGDDVNDVAMLENASLSFAMGNASPAIQRIAKRVTLPQNEGGVGAVIEEILRMN